MSKSTSGSDVLLGCIGIIILFVFMMGYSIVVGGYVISILWAWFITPIFAIPVPAIIACSGLAVFTSYITGVASNSAVAAAKRKDEGSDSSYMVIVGLIHPWMVLGLGWLIHQFV